MGTLGYLGGFGIAGYGGVGIFSVEDPRGISGSGRKRAGMASGLTGSAARASQYITCTIEVLKGQSTPLFWEGRFRQAIGITVRF
jgi:hypothetical protein